MSRALGRYELLRPLARGGMAEVYLARRRAAGIEKWLVVKRMRPERSGDPRFLDLFVREARLSMSLAHQNIVPVFDFGRIDDQVFLAMERVEGKDLGSSLARAGDHRMPPLLAAFVAAECCQALDYAHQRKSPDGVPLGIVHRDVTPRNVLLSWSGEVKLTDFGIAALAGDATSRLLGTPQYMAPEQARSEPIDPRADIYAIGLVLREAVTGVRPRPGTDRDGMLDAARRGELVPWPHLASAPLPAPPSDAELALGSGDHGEPPSPPTSPPADLVTIIDRAAAIDPADRYPDARTMLADLDAFIVADRAAHKGESPTRQLGQWLNDVWDGARDDAEADAAIDAEHLVSFLDDGAIDVLGTGTIRSMAATAAEDVQVDPGAAQATAPGTAASPPAAPPGAKTSVIVAGAATPATTGTAAAATRASRISSANSTVASGSFHTIPASETGRIGQPRERKMRSRAPLASLVLVAIAAGGIVFWVMTSLRDRGSHNTAPATANAIGGPPTAGPSAARPSIEQPSTGQPSAEPTAEQLPTGLAAGQRATAPTAGHPATGHPATGAGTGPRSGTTGHADAGRPGSGHLAPSPPAGRVSMGADAGSGSAGTSGETGGGETGGATGSAGDRQRPATCRVRINLTPWAYYTTDEDSTQRETPGTVDLTPGRHRIHVWNPQLHVERDILIDVPADRDSMNYSEPLQPASLHPDAGLR